MTIETASLRMLSPKTNMFSVGSTSKAWKMARVATGSTAEISDPNAKLRRKKLRNTFWSPSNQKSSLLSYKLYRIERLKLWKNHNIMHASEYLLQSIPRGLRSWEFKKTWFNWSNVINNITKNFSMVTATVLLISSTGHDLFT